MHNNSKFPMPFYKWNVSCMAQLTSPEAWLLVWYDSSHWLSSCDWTHHWLHRRRNSKSATHHWLVITNMLLAVPGSCVCLRACTLCVRLCVCVCPKPEATRPAATITVTDVKELGRLRKRSAPGTTRPARALNQYRTQKHTHTQGCMWQTLT